MESTGDEQEGLEPKVIGVDLDEGEAAPSRRVAKKKKKKTKKAKAANTAAAASAALEEVNLNVQSQALTESLMQDHQRESEEAQQPLDAFKEDMDGSYQATNSAAPVDQDRLSDTGSDNNSDISTGSDSSTNSDYGSRLLSRGPIQKFGIHLMLLLQKTLWMYMRNKLFLIAVILCPIFWCLSIGFMNQQGQSVERMDLPKGAKHQIGPIPHCLGEGCVTIGYSIIGDSDPGNLEQHKWIDDIMQTVAVQNKLIYQKDVKKLTVGTTEAFFHYLELNPNSTLYSVVWCTSEWVISGNLSIPCNYQFEDQSEDTMMFYTLWYNKSLVPDCLFRPSFIPCPKDDGMLFLQNSVDNGILKYLHSKRADSETRAPSIKNSYSNFPGPVDRIYKNMDVMNIFGSYYFILGPILTFMLLLQEIAKEKENRLRQGLNVVGVSHTVYWCHWVIVGTAINFLQAMVLLVSGYIAQFELWDNCPFSILFFVIFWYGQCLVAWAFWISTMVQRQDQANQISYSLIMVIIIIQLVFANSDLVAKLFYNDRIQTFAYARWTIALFEFIPTYAFSMAFGQIAERASKRFSVNSANWIAGKPFTDELYYRNEVYEVKATNDVIRVPSTHYLMMHIIYSMSVSIFLWWYCDHVFASNRGKAYSMFFPFQPSYWRAVFQDFQHNFKVKAKAGRKKRVLSQKDLGVAESQTETFDSATKEKERIIQDEQDGIYCDGLRIMELSKVYRRLPFGMVHQKDVLAVDGVYLEVARNELLCLLGHNGAGKSTLFNMLTGIIGPTSGYATIAGLDIRTEQNTIRKIMGVVPQFDILWDQLTAMEHMRMFSKIKGVHNEDIDEESEALLDQVGLLDVQNARCGTFSGGMKRRLSVAISAIGNPRIIFFDEPTTGMDPVSRRNVWELMQSLKKDKTIILTTHAMEEADVLADRIAVVVDGRIKCVGSPLNLKNVYGDGYKVSLVCEPGNEVNAIKLMDQIAPSNKFVDDSGGSMIFTVPLLSTKEITPLFKLIEERSVDEDIHDGSQIGRYATNEDALIAKLKSYVSDCGISHSTLEEVFMKVTGKKQKKKDRQQREGDKHSPAKQSPTSSHSSGNSAEGELTERNLSSIVKRKSARRQVQDEVEGH